jgi:hypothetical protein
MSSSNNRFGRRTGRQNNDARAEPVLSFDPKRPGARDAQHDAGPSVGRTPPSAPRVDRADAEEFSASFGRGAKSDPIPSFMRGAEPGPRVDREDAQEFGMAPDSDDAPRVERGEKAMETRIPAAERPLYHHLFDEDEKRGAGFGWAAALGSAVIIIVGAVYVWHNFMARPTPGNLLAPPNVASRTPGYTTPAQSTNNTDGAQDTASQGTGMTPPASTAPATRDVATQAEPKAVPYEPPPPPRKTISEAAANPGNLGPPVIPAPAPTNAPPVAKQPAAAPAPILTPPPKRETPRKEAAIVPPKPAPAPIQQDAAPQDIAPPAQPVAAPAVSAPPRLRPPAPATGQPQQLNRDAPASYPQPPLPAPLPQQTNNPPTNLGPTNLAPSNVTPGLAAPPATGTDTVTVDGVTYVNGQEPRALGTLGASQAPSGDASVPPGVPALPTQSVPSYSTRSYAPADRDGGAPLPNDVIILPNGQMAVPNGR